MSERKKIRAQQIDSREKRMSVGEILRASYLKFMKDTHTLKAVNLILREPKKKARPLLIGLGDSQARTMKI